MKQLLLLAAYLHWHPAKPVKTICPGRQDKTFFDIVKRLDKKVPMKIR